jgi:hypothetical protein
MLTQTNATLRHFMAAMLLYPDVQAKAQAELDVVVGSDRLPDHSDRDNLPYVNSVILETLRWKVAVPTGTSNSLCWTLAVDGHACRTRPLYDYRRRLRRILYTARDSPFGEFMGYRTRSGCLRGAGRLSAGTFPAY